MSRSSRKRIDSLSSLSTLSNNPSITVILHTLRRPNKRQWRIQSERHLSTSDKELNSNKETKVKNLSEENLSRIDSKRTTKSVEHKLNLNLTAPCVERVTMATQTEDFLFTRHDYPYGNLRKVNSDLLDYLSVPSM